MGSRGIIVNLGITLHNYYTGSIKQDNKNLANTHTLATAAFAHDENKQDETNRLRANK